MSSLASVPARLPNNAPQPARPAAMRRLPPMISPAKVPMIGPRSKPGSPKNRPMIAPATAPATPQRVAPKRRAPYQAAGEVERVGGEGQRDQHGDAQPTNALRGTEHDPVQDGRGENDGRARKNWQHVADEPDRHQDEQPCSTRKVPSRETVAGDDRDGTRLPAVAYVRRTRPPPSLTTRRVSASLPVHKNDPMANSKSAAKRARQSPRRTLRNRSVVTHLRSLAKQNAAAGGKGSARARLRARQSGQTRSHPQERGQSPEGALEQSRGEIFRLPDLLVLVFFVRLARFSRTRTRNEQEEMKKLHCISSRKVEFCR